ncbi:MAG: transporter substrate-binding domain-containing protein [Firmicutes bacterium]|nr:transporter substrate-binding domain-containing protein [Bacillota bacterium]
MKKNTKRLSSLLLALLMTAAVLFGAAVPVFAEQAPTKSGITTIEELNGKNLGVQTGVLYEDHIKDDLEGETWYYYKMPNDMIPALESNKIVAYLIEEVGFYAQRYEHPELVRLEEAVGVSDFAVIVGNNDKQDVLFAQLQQFISDRRADGWLEKLYDYWVIRWNPNTCKIEERPELTGENGTIHVAIEGGYEPFSFESNGEFSGYDVEFMLNFAAKYGYDCEFHAMEFDSIAPAVIAGKYDFGMNIVVDEERAEASVLTDPYYSCDIVFVLEGETGGEAHFLDGIKDSFYKTFVKEDRWKLFAQGIGTTLLITVCSVVFGTIFGFATYMGCRHGNPLANRAMNAFGGFIHGIPTVVFLMILSFVIFANSSHITAISILGFTLIFGCSMFDMLKVGNNAVHRGQAEAAKALGYSDTQSFFRILLPQAAQHFLPIYKNDVISLIKETSVVGYIAVMDLTKMGDLVRSRTYQAFFSLIAVAIVYFILEWVLVSLVTRVQIKIDPKRRSREKILEGIKEVE